MKILTARNFAIIQLILYIVYISQGSLYATGSIIATLALVALFAIGAVFLFKSLLLRRKQSFFIVWTLFLFTNILYFILGQNYEYLNVLKNIIICSMGFFPFYYLSSHGQKFDKVFLYFFYVSLIAAILSFYNNRQDILLSQTISKIDIVNNVAYSFVFLIPLLFFIKKPLLMKLASLLIIISFIMQGAKRGAIIAGGIGCIMYAYYFFKENPIRGFFKSFLMLLILIAIGYYCYDVYVENEFLISRMSSISEGESSGRDFIYQTLFHAWYDSDSILNLLFGFGFASSVTLTNGLFAHSDWLEVLSNFGFLGFLLYFSLFISLLKICLSLKISYRDRMILLSLASIWIVISMFSMWYNSYEAYTQSIIMGYIVGSMNYSINNKIKFS